MARNKYPKSKTSPDMLPALPVALTSFVGREREISRIKQLLRRTRLLTLSGAGGSGKTRLALKIATQLSEKCSFRDGISWVALASLSNPDLLHQTIVGALGLREMPYEPFIETLVNHLKSKQHFLVLDNCEHLISACAVLADELLSRCPELKIMTTSRESLGIGSEQIFQVPLLSLPDPHSPQPKEKIAGAEAIRLFLDRARAVNPGFSLTNKNANTIAQICWQLDGIPLAIELAATRTNVLSVEQIAARLGDRFTLLSTGSRTALPRHQTLRATLDWSYELLSSQEQVLFRRLAVFAGGWTLEAAEFVCGSKDFEPRQVLDLLSRLVDKSLVTVHDHRGAARYQFLETVRVYAQDKMYSSGEATEIQERHLDFFLKLAEETYTWRFGVPLYGERSRLDRYGVERENIRAALTCSLGGQAIEKGVRMAAALLWFWDMNSYLAEGIEWLRNALAVASRVTPQVHAKVLLSASSLNTNRGNYQEAVDLGEQSVALYREIGDIAGLADALGTLARTFSSQGNQERAIAINEKSMQLFHEIGSDLGVAACLFTLANARQLQGDFEASVPFLEDGLFIYRKLQSADGIHLVLGLMARVYRARGDFAKATLTYNQVMANSWNSGYTFRLAFGLEFYAVLATLQKQAERAARLWGAAHTLRDTSGIARPASQTDYAEYERNAQRQLDSQMYARLYAEGEAMPLEQAVEYAMAAPIPDLSALSEKAAERIVGGLTSRERAVAILVAQAKSNREIAELLVLSERTVEKHVGNILSKLNLHSRMQLAGWVLQQGWDTNQAW